MRALRDALDRVHPYFARGGILEKAYPVYEALDTFLYTPGETTKKVTHVRDGIDLKRMMSIVVLSLIPVTLFGMWNLGHRAHLAMAKMESVGADYALDWHHSVHAALGFGHDPNSFLDNFVYGAIHFLPIYAVCMFVGGHIELVFSVLRGHEINEGFLVTGLLFPLVLPPTIPLWQVAVGIAFGVIVAKEVFGGTGRNFLNPALSARAFLYFAHANENSGDSVWTAVDGFSGPTALGQMAVADVNAVAATEGNAAVASLSAMPRPWGEESMSLLEAFIGTIQGSIGETSTLLCLVGAAILIATGTGSWRIMAATTIGVIATSLVFNAVGSDTNAMYGVPFYWHLCLGGLAFGIVWMTTDPVSASMTQTGKWIYGFLIGFMTVLIRVANPAFPEGIMLAILFGNVFAPLIDFFVVEANVRRRAARYATT